ncbi:cytochrome c oxidase assembly factor 1 [Trichomonascus vanleenenianus]|uniref:Coa1p n=1 Tax=Trichomonascus vanleenenianus TaxID=2268995 RepID=UPI003EC9EBA1
MSLARRLVRSPCLRASSLLVRPFSVSRPILQQAPYKENPNATVDVELPDPLKEQRRVRYSAAAFAVFMVGAFFGIIKYEDANAPVVTSTLYTLRRSQKGREILGNNIQFNSLMPWVSGKLHIARGIVDFSYTAVGEKGSATVHFSSHKDKELRRFVVDDWSLTTPDGVKTSLLDEEFHPFVPGSKDEPTSRPAFF